MSQIQQFSAVANPDGSFIMTTTYENGNQHTESFSFPENPDPFEDFYEKGGDDDDKEAVIITAKTSCPPPPFPEEGDGEASTPDAEILEAICARNEGGNFDVSLKMEGEKLHITGTDYCNLTSAGGQTFMAMVVYCTDDSAGVKECEFSNIDLSQGGDTSTPGVPVILSLENPVPQTYSGYKHASIWIKN